MKPWEIVATYPDLTRTTIDTYASRACAEADARKLQRFLSTQQIHVRVVWNPPQS